MRQVRTPAVMRTTLSAAKEMSAVNTVDLTFALSFEPKNLDASTAQPAFAPRATAIRMLTIEFEAPMAVSAVSSANFPAMTVSASVYNC